MSPFVTLFFDVLVLAALGVAIFYCIRLSRQFNEMQANRKAFDALIASLNVASSKAEAAIHALKDAAAGDGGQLQEKINRAHALSDELEIMIQAGDSLADRLQASAGSAAATINPLEEKSADVEELQPRTRAEKELLEAIRAKQKS